MFSCSVGVVFQPTGVADEAFAKRIARPVAKLVTGGTNVETGVLVEDIQRAGCDLDARRRVELAHALGVSEEDVVDGLAVGNAYTASSLDSPAPEDDGGEGSLADRLGYEDTALEGVEYRESLKPLLAKLPPRERRIIMLRFFANMTQSQIGEEVGISQMHVSRLLTRTLTQLREGLIAD